MQHITIWTVHISTTGTWGTFPHLLRLRDQQCIGPNYWEDSLASSEWANSFLMARQCTDFWKCIDFSNNFRELLVAVIPAEATTTVYRSTIGSGCTGPSTNICSCCSNEKFSSQTLPPRGVNTPFHNPDCPSILTTIGSDMFTKMGCTFPPSLLILASHPINPVKGMGSTFSSPSGFGWRITGKRLWCTLKLKIMPLVTQKSWSTTYFGQNCNSELTLYENNKKFYGNYW